VGDEGDILLVQMISCCLLGLRGRRVGGVGTLLLAVAVWAAGGGGIILKTANKTVFFSVFVLW